MIVGYVLVDGWFCPSCWRRRKRLMPSAQLTRERTVPDEVELMDAVCSDCGHAIKYTGLVLLD